MLVCRPPPPPPPELNLPVIPASAYAAALKEYEDLDETDSEGDDLSWGFVSFVVFKIVSFLNGVLHRQSQCFPVLYYYYYFHI